MEERVTASVQVSMKMSDGSIWVLGADDPSDFEAMAAHLLGAEEGQALVERFASTIKSAGVGASKEAPRQFGGGGYRPNNSGGGAAPAASSDGGDGRPPGPAPTCEHGEKNWRNPQDKPWKGWFCQEGGRDGACKTNWVK